MKHFFIGICFSLLLVSCNDTGLSDGVNYDRTLFLENMADNMIMPAFSDFNTKIASLHTATLTFETDHTEANLTALQNALKEAWVSYQYVAYLEIGPSADAFFRDEVNIFPTDTAAILSKIAAEDYVFTGSANIDVKGFPAIDFLVNGTGTSNAEIVNFYSEPTAGELRFTYLKNVVSELQQIAETVDQSWPAYRATFLAAQGTDIGSSTGILVNEFNKQFDLRLKNGKIGIPSGVKSFERTNPEKVECLYGGYSKELAVASAEAALKIFNGQHFNSNTNGEGFDDYLNALDANVDSGLLSVVIRDKIQTAIDKIAAIEGDLNTAAQVYDAQGDLVLAYNALQAVIPNIKVDMTSEMGVTISFQDNDGD